MPIPLKGEAMRNAVLITVLIFGIVSLAAPGNAQEIAGLDLEAPSKLGLTIQRDEQVKAAGEASIRIDTSWPVTVCLGELDSLDVENAKLVYQAQVKSDLEGTAFLEMWCHFQGSPYFSRGMNDPVEGKSDWKAIGTPFMLQKGQKPEKVTLNIVINGKGTVWVDDLVLSKEALK